MGARKWPQGPAWDERVTAAWSDYRGPKRGAPLRIAEQLGVPRFYLSRTLTRLALTVPRRKEPEWSPAEEALLDSLPLHNLRRCVRIMREQGFVRTETAISIRAKRRHLSRADTHGGYPAIRAAAILGIDAKTVGQLCERGELTARKEDDNRTALQGGHRWVIAPEDLRGYIRANIDRIDLRHVDKLTFFALIDQPAPKPAEPEKPEQMPAGWTDEKRRLAYKRFGRVMVSLSEELNVPANELLTYVLKGAVPPGRSAEGFADTKLPSSVGEPASSQPIAALPAPVLPGTVWDDAKRARLRELAGKVPVAAIAAELGVSRSAVYDEATRLVLLLKLRRHWSVEFIAEIVRLAGAEKRTKGEICVHMGITMYTLDQIARENGIAFEQKGKRHVHKVWPDERIEKLRRHALPGVSSGELAEIMGCSRNSIVSVCRDNDIPLLGRVRPPKPSTARVRAGTVPASRPRATPRPATNTAGRSNIPGGAATASVQRSTVPPSTRVAGDDQLAELPVVAPKRAGNAGTAWVRLRHKDGTRWLRMDGLGWVEKRSDGYIVKPEKLPAVRRAFPLSLECEAMPEPTWRPRDLEFAQVIR